MGNLTSQLIVLAFLSMLVSGTVMNDHDDNVEIISLNESQYCFVNLTTIRVSDNFTSELQNIVNKTEHVIISTTINSTVIFIAQSNGSRCGREGFISKGLFTILIVIYVITILVATGNITLHLVFKELRTIAGVLVMALCGIVIVVTIVAITSLTYSFIKDGCENLTTCVVLASVLFYLTLVYQASKLDIQFHFAYLMYKSYKLQSQSTIDKKHLMIKFVIFAFTSSTLCFLSAVLIDLAVTGRFYSNRDSLCFFRGFDLDDVSVFRAVSIVEFALFVIVEFVVFFIGATLYFLINKPCCKMISTNFRITIALTSTIGVAIILLTVLNGIEVSVDVSLPAVSGGTLTEQLFLFLLFVSSSKVRNGVKKMLVYKERSTSTILSRKSTKEQHVDGAYKDLSIPLVTVPS